MTAVNTFTVNCPACGRTLNIPAAKLGKRGKCPCGQSLMLPDSPEGQARLASAGPTLAPAPLPYRTSGGANDPAKAEEQSAIIRQAIIFTSLLVVLIGIVFGLKWYGGRQAARATPALGEDATVTEMIRDENGTEVREWLKGFKGRMLSGMTDTQAEHYIDMWYKMGATKVYSFGGVVSMSVALELPADPAKRKALFDWVNDWNARSLVKPAADVGQRYLLVRLRL